MTWRGAAGAAPLRSFPRAEDYPEGGWKLDASYAVPDLIPQAWGMPVALAPDSEQRAVDASLALIRQLVR